MAKAEALQCEVDRYWGVDKHSLSKKELAVQELRERELAALRSQADRVLRQRQSWEKRAAENAERKLKVESSVKAEARAEYMVCARVIACCVHCIVILNMHYSSSLPVRPL
jgi:hypothetical protein